MSNKQVYAYPAKLNKRVVAKERKALLESMVLEDTDWQEAYKDSIGSVDEEFEPLCLAAIDALFDGPPYVCYYSTKWVDRCWMTIKGSDNILAVDDLWSIFTNLVADRKMFGTTYKDSTPNFKPILKL